MGIQHCSTCLDSNPVNNPCSKCQHKYCALCLSDNDVVCSADGKKHSVYIPCDVCKLKLLYGLEKDQVDLRKTCGDANCGISGCFDHFFYCKYCENDLCKNHRSLHACDEMILSWNAVFSRKDKKNVEKKEEKQVKGDEEVDLPPFSTHVK